MKTRSRLFRVVGAAALLISMLAATVAPAAAQQPAPFDPTGFVVSNFTAGTPAVTHGVNTIYYPWVANGEDFGLGASETSISVQNLSNVDGQIWIFRGDGDNTWTLATTAYLSGYASKTFTADALGITDGAPVAVVGYNVATGATGWTVPAGSGIPDEVFDNIPGGAVALTESVVILSNPITADPDGGETTQVLACVVNWHSSAQLGLGNSYGYVDAQTGVWQQGPFTQAELQEILNDAQDGGELVNPFGGLNADGDCGDVLFRDGETTTTTVFSPLALGGTALQTATEAAPGNGDDNGDNGDNGDDAELEQFLTTHTATSGYNALNGAEIARFDDWYLPIVQTNCGPGGCWDSMIRVANVSNLNSAVTIRFFPADDGSGSLQTGFQVQQLVNGGDTWHVNLGDLVPEGWVGTAHILSDGGVFAMVDRYKVGYNMWITNTGSSADFEAIAQVPNNNGRFALFAPHVLLDYFGWNTGINVANLAATDNNVSIQYFNMIGNATQVLNQRLAAHGMTYFYDPSVAAQNNSAQDVRTDPNAGVVGSAIIWSEYPVAVAVDATKYPESDPRGGDDVFQATSYNATANVFPWQAVPYVTKGNPIDGSGATSGINIMNPNSVVANASVYWVNPSGFQADNFGTSGVSIPAFANGFVYTLWQHNLPNGFLGAAQVVANVPVAAVSANVNYDVEGDGSAIFNAFNPCGLYRVGGPCSFGDALEPGGQSLTKYFVDDADNPIPGVTFTVASTSGANFQREATTGVDGSAIITNIPVGTYELEVIDLSPAFDADASDVYETFVIEEGEDLVLENTLVRETFPFTKEVVLVGPTGADLAITDARVWITPFVGSTIDGLPVLGVGEEFNFADAVVTGVDGAVTFDLLPGNYALCLFFEEGEATFVNPATGDDVPFVVGEVDGAAGPFTYFGDDADYIVFCEVVEVEVLVDDDDENVVTNEVSMGQPGIFVQAVDVGDATSARLMQAPESAYPGYVVHLFEGECVTDLDTDDAIDSQPFDEDGEAIFFPVDSGDYCVLVVEDDDLGDGQYYAFSPNPQDVTVAYTWELVVFEVEETLPPATQLAAFTEEALDEQNGNWVPDRRAPHTGPDSVEFAERTNVMQFGIDVNDAHTDGYRRTQGLKTMPLDQDFGYAVEVDLYIDPDWQDKAVRAGVWVAPSNGSGGRDEIWGVLEFVNVEAVTGDDNLPVTHEGFRIWETGGGWVEHLDTPFEYGTWVTLRIELDIDEQEYIYYINGVRVGTVNAPGAQHHITQVILNIYNFGRHVDAIDDLDIENYSVHFHAGS